MTFLSYYAGFFVRPSRTAALLAGDPRRLRLGLYAFLVPLVGYVGVYVGLSQSGAYPSTFAPWIAIEAEHYYRYNLFLLPPSMIAGWLLASAVVQLLGPLVGAKGTFEDTVAVLGFAISVAHWSLLPHDLVVAVLGATHVIDGRAHEHAMNAPSLARTLLWTFMAVYAVAFPVVFSAAVRGAHRVKTPAAILLGAVGFAVYQLVFVTFNR